MTRWIKQTAVYLLIMTTRVTAQGSTRVQNLVPPDYPPLARMARLQGKVVLYIQILENGRVGEVHASGGHRLLQQEAEKNIRQWTFENFPVRTKFPLRRRIVYMYRMEGGPGAEKKPTIILHLPNRVDVVTNPPGQYW